MLHKSLAGYENLGFGSDRVTYEGHCVSDFEEAAVTRLRPSLHSK